VPLTAGRVPAAAVGPPPKRMTGRTELKVLPCARSLEALRGVSDARHRRMPKPTCARSCSARCCWVTPRSARRVLQRVDTSEATADEPPSGRGGSAGNGVLAELLSGCGWRARRRRPRGLRGADLVGQLRRVVLVLNVFGCRGCGDGGNDGFRWGDLGSGFGSGNDRGLCASLSAKRVGAWLRRGCRCRCRRRCRRWEWCFRANARSGG
jgi:hypothetical protein